MKTWILALVLAVLTAALLPSVAEAKRIGGGGSSGMQRSMPTRPAPNAVPAQPAAPMVPAAPGAVPKRSWMGPIAGLAAGLGIAALFSHFGMGGELGNLVAMLLLAAVAFYAVRFLMRRFAPSAPPRAMAGGAGLSSGMSTGTPAAMNYGAAAPMVGSAVSTPGGAGPVFAPSLALPLAGPSSLPAGFDVPAFERIAKLIFIRMQAANDAADLNDLRAFTTPEMFAAVKLDLQDRGAQQTDVVRVDAQVLDVTAEAGRQIVSVRYHGLIREEKDGPAEPFDEVWHLVKPADGSREWAIAGIQQTA